MKRLAAAILFALALPGGAGAVERSAAEAIFGRALAMAAAIRDAKDRAQALQHIALAQAEWGDAEAALLTSRSIGDPAIAAATLTGVAATQNTARHSSAAAATLREANATAQTIAAAKERSAALAMIASEQVKAGEVAGAQATAMAIEDADDRDRAFDEIAIARAEAADFKGALAAANDIADAGWRAAALREIAALQAAAGDWDGALATATAIEQAYWREWALRDIAVHVDLGDRTMAKAILDDALAAARLNADGAERAEALALVAAAQAEAGDATAAAATYREARATAMAASGADGRAEALTRIAAVQAEAGAIEDALNTADAIEDAGKRMQALGVIASAQAGNRSADVKDFMEHLFAALGSMGRSAGLGPSTSPTYGAGDVKGALRTASLIENPGVRLEALALIADRCIVTGDRAALQGPIRAALATVRQADRDFSYVLPFIALVQVVARDIEGLRAIAREFDPNAETLAFIAWAEAALGDRAGSEEALRDVLAKAEMEADLSSNDHFLGFVALTQARLGDVRAALSTVDRMGGPQRQAEALADIAAARSPFSTLR